MAGVRDVRRARLAMLGGLLVAGLVLAACGGGGSGSSASANTASTTTVAGGGRGRFSLTAFTTCMASHGVTLKLPTRPANGTPPSTTPGETRPQRPAGGGGFGGFGGNFADRFKTAPAGVDPTKYAAALAACRSTLPTGGGGGGALNSSAFQAYRSCLQDHGVTLPATGGFGNINRSDPKVQAAVKTCQPLLAAGGFGRATTTTVPAA
jgi:hypothetical protein